MYQDPSRANGNHPLSIEAIFPTRIVKILDLFMDLVTILCQSRLFFPPGPNPNCQNPGSFCNHPLSIEAIFPTDGANEYN